MTHRDRRAAATADRLLRSAEDAADAAVCLCAARLESTPPEDRRRAAALRAMAAAVEAAVDAGDLAAAATLGVAVTAILVGRAGTAVEAMATALVRDRRGDAVRPAPLDYPN